MSSEGHHCTFPSIPYNFYVESLFLIAYFQNIFLLRLKWTTLYNRITHAITPNACMLITCFADVWRVISFLCVGIEKEAQWLVYTSINLNAKQTNRYIQAEHKLMMTSKWYQNDIKMTKKWLKSSAFNHNSIMSLSFSRHFDMIVTFSSMWTAITSCSCW